MSERGAILGGLGQMSTCKVLRFTVLAATLASAGCSKSGKSDLPGKLVWSNNDGIYVCDFSEGSTEGRLVYSALMDGFGLTVSPGGAYVCFHDAYWPGSGKEHVYTLLRIGLEDGRIDTLIRGSQRLGNPAFSPNNKRMAFLICGKRRVIKPKGRFLPELLGPPAASCAILDVETREYRVITESDLYPSTPSWTPDGNSIWVSTYEGRMVRIDLEGNEVEFYGQGLSPALSPDGTYLAYLDLDRRTICVADLKRETKRVLTSRFTYHAPLPYSPKIRWSPDSKYLLYECWTGTNRIMGWSSGFVVIPAHRRGLPIALGTNTIHAYGVDWVP